VRYLRPHPLPDGRLLVACSQERRPWEITIFDFEKRVPGQTLVSRPQWDMLEAVSLAPRPEYEGKIDSTMNAESSAVLQCDNLYDSDTPMSHFIKKGDIRQVRLVEGISEKRPPDFSLDQAHLVPLLWRKSRILGEVPVASDGSISVKVPVDTPLQIQVLNANHLAVQTMPGWIWVRPGARFHCAGCHESPKSPPENPDQFITGKVESEALLAQPHQRRTVDFKHQVWPILETRCTTCHAGPTPAGGLAITAVPVGPYIQAYQSLLAPRTGRMAGSMGKYVYPGFSYRSLLARLLCSPEGAPRSGIDHPRTPLNAAEQRTIIEWIDLGAHWDGEVK
jgi:hypothetical protein